jgi:hypothetical protein
MFVSLIYINNGDSKPEVMKQKHFSRKRRQLQYSIKRLQLMKENGASQKQLRSIAEK